MPAPRPPRAGSRPAAASGRAERRAPRPAGSAPSAAALHEAALAHLARFAATQAGLLRVLERRIDRWLRAATAETPADPTGAASEQRAAAAAIARAAAQGVVARLAAAGAVDDAAFAESRGRSLGRAGRSRRATLAHLQARGVAPELARASLPEDPEAELAAALAHARRRRLGPFASAAPSDRGSTAAEADEPGEAREASEAARAAHRRALANMARAGFPQEVASRALGLDPEAAEALLLARRRT